MKTYPHNVTVTTVEEAVNWLIKANNSNTDILKSVVKTNNRLVFAVLVLGFGGYLACNLFNASAGRIILTSALADNPAIFRDYAMKKVGYLSVYFLFDNV